MDIASIAVEVADHLRGRDDIATADVSPADPGAVLVRTQGGKSYTVIVAEESHEPVA
jgi:hypothetical protein